jgi:2-iminobutanoate/2-iminopropanoate deaminase
VSGQIGRTPAGELAGESVERQTEQTIRNLEEVLRAAGASLANVVKVSVFLADIDDFAKMNEVYRRLFPQSPPARTTMAVSLVRGAKVEMDAVAWTGTQ